ncbi:MAG: sulfurtransferase [Candidatus Obscuribacterales bacterium]|nr:sulfurtransferase [Candidatus Obscuribacterales bacterium]
MDMQTLNIAAYKFIAIPEPKAWLLPLKERCLALGLKGTVVLAEEGINLFLAGSQEAIDAFLNYLREDELFGGRFADMEIKESFSTNKPFKRMIVRQAKEIITMRHPTIQPESGRAPSVKADTLKEWLDRGHDDEGREILLLDTRNSFEVKIGTFKNAVDFGIERFSQFPESINAAAADQKNGLQDKTIVSFCTGGIRCEKAALYMQELNLPRVYQLEGGILRYFEEVGGAHWDGECFVFDERVALDPSLKATTNYKRLLNGELELID